MRTVMIISILCAICTCLAAQSQGDPYEIQLVQGALSARSGAEKIVRSVTQKHLSRLGDRASIALLKILDETELTDPQTIRAFLPLIEVAFAEPRFISLEVDKKPSITLLLLNHLREAVGDENTQRAIQQTIDIVGGRAAR